VHPRKAIPGKHGYHNPLRVLDFVSFRLFEVNFGGCRKQKTHNFRYGFPFAEKEELQLITLNVDYQLFINFILVITHRITHLVLT